MSDGYVDRRSHLLACRPCGCAVVIGSATDHDVVAELHRDIAEREVLLGVPLTLRTIAGAIPEALYRTYMTGCPACRPAVA
jgi:hypothetical protein